MKPSNNLELTDVLYWNREAAANRWYATIQMPRVARKGWRILVISMNVDDQEDNHCITFPVNRPYQPIRSSISTPIMLDVNATDVGRESFLYNKLRAKAVYATNSTGASSVGLFVHNVVDLSSKVSVAVSATIIYLGNTI